MQKHKFVFNPYKELNYDKEIRLVIQDWKNQKVHSEKVIQPFAEFLVHEEELEDHLYYRYKYQRKKEGQWEDFTKYNYLTEKRTVDGLKYLYYPYPGSSALIVIFQALASTPSYNYVKILIDLPVSKLYIKDEYGPPPTHASYYLGKDKNFDLAYRTSMLIEDIRQQNDIPKKNVICAGSSKGGYASLYQAYLNGYGYVVAGGPQIYLGNYLGKSLGNSKSVLAPIYSFITGSAEKDDIEWANDILPNIVKSEKYKSNPILFIHVGKDEPHYEEHVLPFYNFLQELGKSTITLDLGEYNNHDELAQYYPKFLLNKVKEILKRISPSPMLFKRTEPNSSTLEIAEKIMNNEIYLFKNWKPYKFDGELTWDEDPYNDRTWKFYLHEIRMVSFLVNAYELNRNEKYLEKAKWYIESWISKNTNIPVNIKDAPAWSGHGTANRLLNLLYFWCHYKDIENKDIKFETKFISLLEEHGLFLENDNNYENYNHGIFQDQSLMELAVLFPEFALSNTWLQKSVERLTKRINNDFSASGIHKEHSPAYHLLVMKLFMNIKEFMDFYGISYSDELKNKFHLMQDYLAIIVDRDGLLPLLGDTGHSKVSKSLKEEEISSEYWKYKSSGGRYGKPLERSFYSFPDSGVAVYKGENNNNGLEWIFTSAFHSTVHKHADDLSFVMRYGKTNYFVDGGRYNYKEKDPYRQYFRSVFAHNSIAVDNQTYKITSGQSGKSSIIDYGEKDLFYYVIGEHTLYKGVTIQRAAIQMKNGPLLIHDRIFSNENHKYSQIFNLGKDVKIEENNENTLLLMSKLDNSSIEIKQLFPMEELSIFEGNTEPILGWQSFELNQKHAIKHAQFSKSGKSVDFLTVINPNDLTNIDNVTVEQKSHQIFYKINTSDHKTHELFFNDKPSSSKTVSKVDNKMINRVILSNQNDKVLEGTTIKATIDAKGDNLTYAWYIYNNNERIDFKRYSSELKSINIKLDQPGSYHLKAYVKDGQNNKASMNTGKIIVYKKNSPLHKEKRSIIGLYEGEKVLYSELTKIKGDYDKPTILTINKNDTNYDFLIKTKNDSPFLYVLGSGAYDSKEYKPPIFQRHSWIDDLNANVIFFNDPTLYLGDINLGWGQGTNQEYCLETIAGILKVFVEKIKVEHNKILFYGSSAGGFMSLVLGGYFNGSSVLVNNPQTIVPNYYRKHVEAMYQISYPGMGYDDISAQYEDRLNIFHFYKTVKNVPNIYYLQNAACQHDMENHFKPFSNEIAKILKENDKKEFISHFYWDEKSNHNPLGKEDTLYHISRATELFLNKS